MTELWLPPSARQGETFDLDGLEVEVQALGEDDCGRVLGPDQAVFLAARDFGFQEIGRGEVPAVAVEFKPLREAVMNGVAKVELFGICQGLSTHDGTIVPWPNDEWTAHMRLAAYQVHVWIGKAPEEWKQRALAEGFAFSLLPAYDDGRVPYIATGPMTFGDMVIAGSRRGDKVGRNDPCPCGSGLKSKRCCA